MIGESTMNEYKAYKNLVKHNRRINRVFSELSAKNSFCAHRPGVDKKALVVAMASCSAAPPKAPRRRSSKKGKSSTGDTSSATICPDKTKSLKLSKQKCKTSEAISDAEIQAASSLSQLGQKKIKTVVKKVVAAEVRRVPSAFDDDMIGEPRPKGFSSSLWCALRFNIHRSYSPDSENELVDIESFSDGATGAEKTTTDSVVIADLEVLLLILLLLKTKLLLNLLGIWRGLFKEKKILLKIFLWSKRMKNFPRARILLPRSLP
jgi:hypothetical protein